MLPASLLLKASGRGPSVQAGAVLGNFSATNYFTALNGPPLGSAGAGNTIGMIFTVPVGGFGAGNNAPAANDDGGHGYIWDFDAAGHLFLIVRGGIVAALGLFGPGVHWVLATMTPGGQLFTARDGMVQAQGASGYTPQIGTTPWVVGAQQAGLIPFTGGGMLAYAGWNRAFSSNELAQFSSMGFDNRYQFPSTILSDPACVYDWNVARDWDGVSGVSTPRIGSTFTVVGAPTKTPISELVTPVSVGTFQDVSYDVPYQGANAGSARQQNSFARWRYTGNDRYIAITLQSSLYLIAPQPQYASCGLYRNGTWVANATASNSLYPTTVNVDLGAVGPATIDVLDGGQAQPGGAGTGIFATIPLQIRTSVGQCTPQPTTTRPKRIVFTGDSIPAGGDANPASQNVWTMLVRDDYPGGVTVDAVGYQGIFTEYSQGGGSMNAFAQRLVTAYTRDNAGATANAGIWIQKVLNDYLLNLWRATQLATLGYGPLLDAIRSLHATVPIYCQSATHLVAPASEGPNAFGIGNALVDYNNVVQAAVAARAGWAVPPIFVDGFTFVTLLPGDYDADGIHPVNSGHAKIKTAVKTTLGY